jgi:hypothetical protein
MLDIGFASGYETLLFNDDDIFVSYFGVGSLAYVFMSPGGAELLHDAALAVYMDDPEYRELSVSVVGDETAAFVSRSTIDGFDFEYYVVAARQGNVNAIVLIGGLAEVTQLSDAVGYARRMLEKATRNGAVVTSEGSGDTPLNLETSDSLVLPSVQEWAEKVDMHIADQLQTP